MWRYTQTECMDIVASIFTIIWGIGFFSGLVAAAGLVSLRKHGVNVPFLLRYSGLSVFFSKYYPDHNNKRQIVLFFQLICITCILVGGVFIFVAVQFFI